jgi:NADPH:quinone reductase-like Zn-dependent oxidoreductase
VSFAQAATLPVAGLTAYHALLQGGLLLNRRVLITAATGGVGNFAIQLARLSGADVTAHIRKPQDQSAVEAAGANSVAIGEDLATADKLGSYDLVIESVGGKVLGDALGLLAPGGIVVSFGTTAGAEVTFNASRFYGIGGARLYGLILFRELKTVESAAIGLKRLANLVATGQVRPAISVEAPWTKVAEIAQQLTDRQFSGKAVLHIAE